MCHFFTIGLLDISIKFSVIYWIVSLVNFVYVMRSHMCPCTHNCVTRIIKHCSASDLALWQFLTKIGFRADIYNSWRKGCVRWNTGSSYRLGMRPDPIWQDYSKLVWKPDLQGLACSWQTILIVMNYFIYFVPLPSYFYSHIGMVICEYFSWLEVFHSELSIHHSTLFCL